MLGQSHQGGELQQQHQDQRQNPARTNPAVFHGFQAPVGTGGQTISCVHHAIEVQAAGYPKRNSDQDRDCGHH